VYRCRLDGQTLASTEAGGTRANPQHRRQGWRPISFLPIWGRCASGNPQHFQPGALLRAGGILRLRDEVDAAEIVVKSKVATIQEEQRGLLPP